MNNKYLISTDLKRKMSLSTPQLVQYDNVVLQFKIFDNGLPVSTESSTRIEVTNLRPDGKAIVGVGIPKKFDDGIWGVEYHYLGSEMKVIGENKVAVSVFYDDKKISILPFKVQIIQDIREILGEESIEDSGILTQLIESAEEALETVHEANKEYERLHEKVQTDLQGIASSIEKAEEATAESNKTTNEAKEALQNMKDLEGDITSTSQRIFEEHEIAINEVEVTNVLSKKLNEKLAQTNTKGEKIIADTEEVIELSKEQTSLSEQQTEVTKQQGIIAQQQGEVAKEQGDFAKEQGEIAKDLVATLQTENSDLSEIKEEAINATLESIEQTEKSKQFIEESKPLIDTLEEDLKKIDNLEHVGIWSDIVQYKKNQEVLYNGSTYRARLDNLNVAPTNESNWQLIAQKGVDGTGAVSAVNGNSPDNEGNVDLGKLVTLSEDNTLQQSVKANMLNLNESNLKNIIVTKEFPTGEYPEGTILIIQKDVSFNE